jgi:hypothetical protein
LSVGAVLLAFGPGGLQLGAGIVEPIRQAGDLAVALLLAAG